MAKVTHTEAQAVYPIRETFPAGDYGESFMLARERARALTLEHAAGVRQDGDTSPDAAGELDGVILPGASDDDPAVPRLARWLGAVTLYYRPRAA